MVKYRQFPVVTLCLALAVSALSCASRSMGTGSASSGSAKAPAWVVDTRSVYPDRDWLTAVETGNNKAQAEAHALAALSRIVRQNVESTSTSSRDMTRTNTGLINTSSLGQGVLLTSAVDNLMGVKTNTWKEGSLYHGIAYLNRAEGAASYRALVREGELHVASLQQEAARKPATFDAYVALSRAVTEAVQTDNYVDILNVIDTSREGQRAAYGSASAVAAERSRVAQSIIIDVNIRGDTTQRVGKAFAAYFAKMGFKTVVARKTDPHYTLEGDLTLDTLDLPNPQNYIYVRYTITAALTDNNGVECLAYTANSREGHVTAPEARNRAIAAAEKGVAADFTPKFEAFLGL